MFLQATVEASTNLTNWQAIQPVSLVAGNGLFRDANATNYPQRFYRSSIPDFKAASGGFELDESPSKK